MKKFTLILGLAACLASPALGMDSDHDEADQSKQILQCKLYRVPNYETSLNCTHCIEDGFTQINFKILNNNHNDIGEILLQFYPQPGSYYKTSTAPVVRLRYIEVQENHQRKRHGTRAMETMFVALRKAPLLPKNTEMWLEYSSGEPHLKKFYESFGFEHTNEPSVFETKVMKVALKKTQFPYFAKQKEKK